MKKRGKVITSIALVVFMVFTGIFSSTVFAAYRVPFTNTGTARPHDNNHIIAFSVPGEILAPLQEIDASGREIWVTKSIVADPLVSGTPSYGSGPGEVMFRMPSGTDVTKITPTVTLSPGATIDPPLNGVETDFSSPRTYTVTSSDGKAAAWVITCYVNNKAASLTSDNARLQEAFAWAINKTNQFVVTGKWALVNKRGDPGTTNFNGAGPDSSGATWRYQYFKNEPSYWAGYFNRTAYCPRDSSHQTIGAHLAGWLDENWNMYKTYAYWAAQGTGSRRYHTIWQVNFNGTPNFVDYTNSGNYRTEGPSNFDLMDKAYKLYKWTNDQRYINDPDLWNFFSNTVTNLVAQHSTMRPNGVVQKDNLTTIGYNERFGSVAPTEAADTIACQYASYMAYADMLKDKGDIIQSNEWFAKAAEFKDYFNNDWSVGSEGPEGLYVTALSYVPSTGAINRYEQFGKETHLFIPYMNLSEPGDRNNRLMQFISDSLRRGINGAGSNAWDPMRNLEAYTYVPEGFWRYDWNEVAWRWQDYIYNRKDLAHEQAAQGTNGDYPEMSYTYISQTVEGMMGIVPDAPNNRIATGSRLPGATTNPDTGAAIAGVNWVDLKDVRLGERYVNVKHEGKTKTTLSWNTEDAATALIPLTWEARFPGRYDTILVDGAAQTAIPMNINGVPYSYVNVSVPVNTAVVAEVGAVMNIGLLSVSGKVSGNRVENGIPATITLKQMGVTKATVTANADGTYTINGLAPGQYALYANMTNYNEGAAPVNLDMANLTGVDLILMKNLSGLSMTLDATDISLSYGGGTTSRKLNPTLNIYPEDNQGVVWSSSNTAVATVDTDGVVRSTGVGTAVITAESAEYGSLVAAACNVTVRSFVPVTGVSLPLAHEMTVGKTYALDPIFIPEDTSERGLIWTSSNTAVVTVNGDGLITAVSVGDALITCVSAFDPSIPATIHVGVKPLGDPIRTPYVTSINSGDATNNVRNSSFRVGGGAGAIGTGSTGGVYFGQSNGNPLGSWHAINITVPADGVYKIDLNYYNRAENDACDIQAYIAPNPTNSNTHTFDNLEEYKVGVPLDMRIQQTTAAGAVNCAAEVGTTQYPERFWKKTLAEEYYLTAGTYTFKTVVTRGTAQWGHLLVSVILTPMSGLQYDVTVNDGIPSKSKADKNSIVILATGEGLPNQTFDKWVTTSSGVTLTSEYAAITTFAMPDNDVVISAVHIYPETAITLINEDGKAKAYYAIVANDGKIDYSAILAIYDPRGALSELINLDDSAANGEVGVKELTADLPAGYSAKAFIWESVTFRPLTISKSI